jgi:hypothetical protein
MYIEVNTTHQITHQESLKAEVATMVEHDIARFADQVTHVEVHLDDENGGKGGADDIRCTIEARVSGRQSLAVTAYAVSVAQAARSAAAKLARALESAIGKQITKQRVERAVPLDDEGLSEA